MNTTLAAELARKHAVQLEKFGEDVTFWPGEAEEIVAKAIVYRSARPETRTPGNVTSVFVVLSLLPNAPAKDDVIQIGTDQFSLGDPNDAGDGSTTIIVRKKSQATP